MTAIAIHGGAGALPATASGPEHAARYRAQLAQTVDAGHRALARGGNALEAVVTAVCALEDCGLFNAGRGAAHTHTGRTELDAAVMEGTRLAAGAVACVRHVRNPVLLARHLLEASPHVLLAGAGAENYARAQGLELVPDDYFRRPRRQAGQQDQLARAQDTGTTDNASRYGTVGAVALDRNGTLAAATSTGGTRGKLDGRVGDSPLIGAGTYAANGLCAVSATGAGEHFIRAVAAYDVAALIAYRDLSLDDAVDEVLAKIAARGGAGGMIAIDSAGRVSMAFNTQGMYRAAIDAQGRRRIGILQ